NEEVKNIINTSKEKIDLAINLVIERIVKFNGNS
ncbi:MAG TPA: ATPase, partial [Clostridium sp.]|nr:ATPase [Clostridium sp.]